MPSPVPLEEVVRFLDPCAIILALASILLATSCSQGFKNTTLAMEYYLQALDFPGYFDLCDPFLEQAIPFVCRNQPSL